MQVEAGTVDLQLVLQPSSFVAGQVPAEPGPTYEGQDWRHFRMTPSLEGHTFSPMVVDATAAEEVQTYDFTAVPVSPLRSEYYLIVWSWLESR